MLRLFLFIVICIFAVMFIVLVIAIPFSVNRIKTEMIKLNKTTEDMLATLKQR